MWLKLAQCHMALGSSADAIRVYQQGIISTSVQICEEVILVLLLGQLPLVLALFFCVCEGLNNSLIIYFYYLYHNVRYSFCVL